MYEHILLPTDGSEGTERAVDNAVDLATTYDATLSVLYVVDVTAVPPDVGADTVLEQLEEVGEQAVEEVASIARERGVEDVETSVVRGTPHAAIEDVVDRRGVDLVVMGTHGRTGIDRYLLGSVAEKVVRTSPVPVLTVRMSDD